MSHQRDPHTDPFGDNVPLAYASQTDFHSSAEDKSPTGNRLAYHDENSNHFPNPYMKTLDDSQDASLVHNAATVGRSDNYRDLGKS